MYYEINYYIKDGTALIKADSEEQAVKYLHQLVNFDEFNISEVYETEPSSECYDIVDTTTRQYED